MFRRFPQPYPIQHEWAFTVWHVLFSLAILALLVMLAVWLVTSIRRGGHVVPPAAPPAAPPRRDGALEEARMRYARGEIGREDFLRIAEDLGAPPPAKRALDAGE